MTTPSTGFRSTGDYSTGAYSTGDYSTGDRSTGDYSTGDRSTGDRSTGNNSTGDRSTGNYSTGNYSTGHYSTGNYSTGNRSIGYYSTGHCSTGDYSTGHSSTGDRSTGHYSTGNYSTGNYSTGHYSTCDYAVGVFQTVQDCCGGFSAFNVPCSREHWDASEKPRCLHFPLTAWVEAEDMSPAEKSDNPLYETTGGYLKVLGFKEAFSASCRSATDDDIELLKQLPNFDADVFFDVSGYDVLTRDKVKVTANGKDVYISKASAESLGLV